MSQAKNAKRINTPKTGNNIKSKSKILEKLLLAKNTHRKIKLVKYILYDKKFSFLRKFLGKCQFKNQKFWKIND